MADEQQSPPPPEPAAQKNSPADRNLGGRPNYKVTNNAEVGAQFNGNNNVRDQYQGTVYNVTIYNTGAQTGAEALNHFSGNDLKVNDAKSSESDSSKAASRQGLLTIRVPDNPSVPRTEKTPSSTPIPQSEEEISTWYSQLSGYDQCFVQAMAIFSGSTLNEVFFATNRLYEPITEATKLRTQQTFVTHDAPPPPAYKLEAPDNSSLIDRMRRTHVKMELINRARCFVWQDRDAFSFSHFQVRLLHFLADSAPMWIHSTFLEQLETWVINLEDDNAGSALWAQGVIWGHSPARLHTEITFWSDEDEWYRASFLLYGAYEADFFDNPSTANDFNNSFVLQTLAKWVRTARRKANGKKGRAAALTYMFIGTHNLPIALSGLDKLLQLPAPKNIQHQQEQVVSEEDDGDDNEDDWDFAISADTYAGVVHAYYELAQSGYTRDILFHLAQRVKNASHYRMALTNMKYTERQLHRFQRIITLLASLDIFFNIAQRSLQNVKYSPWVNYDLTRPLPTLTTLNNVDDREILLASLLSNSWREQICTLICAALMEKSLGDYDVTALNLLRKWADLVLKDQGPHPDQIRQSYLKFLVEIAQMIPKWTDYWQNLDFKAPPALTTYKNRLLQWEKEGLQKKRPLAALAQEALAQFPS